MTKAQAFLRKAQRALTVLRFGERDDFEEFNGWFQQGQHQSNNSFDSWKGITMTDSNFVSGANGHRKKTDEITRGEPHKSSWVWTVPNFGDEMENRSTGKDPIQGTRPKRSSFVEEDHQPPVILAALIIGVLLGLVTVIASVMLGWSLLKVFSIYVLLSLVSCVAVSAYSILFR